MRFNHQNFTRQELTPIKVKGHVRDPNPFLSLDFSAEKKEKNPKDPVREAESASKRAKLTGREGFSLLRNRIAKLRQLKLSLKEVRIFLFEYDLNLISFFFSEIFNLIR